MENAMMQVTYFLDGSMANLLFFVTLFNIEREWLLIRNLATILPLKSNMFGKFQRFSAIDEIMEILKNNWISENSFKIKNCKG